MTNHEAPPREFTLVYSTDYRGYVATGAQVNVGPIPVVTLAIFEKMQRERDEFERRALFHLKSAQESHAALEAKEAELTAYRDQAPEDYLTPYENELLGDLKQARADLNDVKVQQLETSDLLSQARAELVNLKCVLTGVEETALKNSEYDDWRVARLEEQLTAEREKSARLVEALKHYKDIQVNLPTSPEPGRHANFYVAREALVAYGEGK